MGKSELYIVVLNDNVSWKEDFIAKTGAIDAVYLVDKSYLTHCCDLRGMYWIELLYFLCDPNISDELKEEIDSYVSNEYDGYVLPGTIDLKGAIYTPELTGGEQLRLDKLDFEFEGEILGDDYREKFEEVKEYCICNHHF